MAGKRKTKADFTAESVKHLKQGDQAILEVSEALGFRYDVLAIGSARLIGSGRDYDFIATPWSHDPGEHQDLAKPLLPRHIHLPQGFTEHSWIPNGCTKPHPDYRAFTLKKRIDDVNCSVKVLPLCRFTEIMIQYDLAQRLFSRAEMALLKLRSELDGDKYAWYPKVGIQLTEYKDDDACSCPLFWIDTSVPN